jgi:hypothetical protein
MPIKPSKNEEEYFAKKDGEHLEKHRQVAQEQQTKAERQSHYMKCPKCGADLVEEEFRKVLVDRCPECHGVWFDAGEVDKMVDQGGQGFVHGILQSVFSLRGGIADAADR